AVRARGPARRAAGLVRPAASGAGGVHRHAHGGGAGRAVVAAPAGGGGPPGAGELLDGGRPGGELLPHPPAGADLRRGAAPAARLGATGAAAVSSAGPQVFGPGRSRGRGFTPG